MGMQKRNNKYRKAGDTLRGILGIKEMICLNVGQNKVISGRYKTNSMILIRGGGGAFQRSFSIRTFMSCVL